jgi:predicted AlkP superfamily pyrophosphatase or phosphodiesterase
MTAVHFSRFIVVAFVAALSACHQSPRQIQATTPTSPLILISLDGFAADYWTLHPDVMPNLQRLRREGVFAEGLIPVFPSNTFPNHYTLVTGLYPAQHGMVNNEFFDSKIGTFFRYTQDTAVRDSRWWSGEPVWVTAIKQGKLAATSFWIGSEAEIGGVRPTYWRPYDIRLPFEPRLEELTAWLKKPAEQRPSFIALYLEETNGAGHRFGPNSAELAAAIKLVDARIGEVLRKCAELGYTPNVVVVSDHGMTAVNPARVSTLEDYIDVNAVQIETEGSVVGLRPSDGNLEHLMNQVRRIPHAKAYRLTDLPSRLHMSENPRLSPVWILPDEGAHVVKRSTLARLQKRYPETGYIPGDHGYDPALRSMHGLFVAHGPAFRRGVTLRPVENIHVYNLLCAVLGITPAPNSGDDRLVRSVLLK